MMLFHRQECIEFSPTLIDFIEKKDVKTSNVRRRSQFIEGQFSERFNQRPFGESFSILQKERM